MHSMTSCTPYLPHHLPYPPPIRSQFLHPPSPFLHPSMENVIPCLTTQCLYCIKSRIIEGFKRLRRLVTTLPEMLNSLSTPAPVAGTARTSRAIFDNLGYVA